MNPNIMRAAVLAAVVCLLFSPLAALGQSQAGAGKAKVNINAAGLNELQTLPRVGPKIAQRILDYRKDHGSFKRPEDLMKVKGIGEKTFNNLRDLITVGAEPQAK